MKKYILPLMFVFIVVVTQLENIVNFVRLIRNLLFR